MRANLGLGPPEGFRLVLTGGCGGIGRVLVAKALAAGVDVTVLDRPAALAAHSMPGVTCIEVDVADETTVAQAFAEVAARQPAIDGFVHLAGFSNTPAPFADVAPAAWDEALAGNLRGAYLACRAALPLLAKGDGPSLVAVSSGQGVRPVPGFSPYGAAKAGVISMTRAIALEYAPTVRANAVAPGAVRTAFLTGGEGRAARPGADVDTKAAAYAQSIPMGRIAEPEDVADPILFLLGPGARFITGQVLHVNGGGLMA